MRINLVTRPKVTFLTVIAALVTYLVVAAASVIATALAIWVLYHFAAWMVG
jgi:hypothetical protein